jgi:hypothetical protein
MYDFANPTKHMRQPWRILKSLGLYKPKKSDWGWDFVTQAAGRISNADAGYRRADFDLFLAQGGFYFLPASLQGSAARPDILTYFKSWFPLDQGENPQIWIQFLIDTLHRCQAAIRKAHFGCIAIYLAFVVVGSGKRLGTVLTGGILRILLLHGLIFGLAFWTYRDMESRSWAHNLQNGRLYRGVPSGPHATLPNIPASLPLNKDVLILHEMQSDYMASFTRVLEVTHPGNKAWNKLLSDNAIGYPELSSHLQEKLRSSLLQTVREQQRRIMTKNMGSNWAEVSDTTADWFCHKELVSKSNPYIQEAMKLTDYFLSETRFGYWRDTVLHRKYIPGLLMKLQDDILRLPRRRESFHTGSSLQSLNVSSSLKIPPVSKPLLRNRSSLPPRRKVVEPFPGAWFKEGDVVEATYGGRLKGKIRRNSGCWVD